MKIKILTYCFGLLLIGFAAAVNASPLLVEKFSPNQSILKTVFAEKHFLENNLSQINSGGSKESTSHIVAGYNLHSISLSLDFQVEQIIAHQENLFRTSRRFTTYLKI